MITGIYKITNNINGKIYIGQSIDIEHRWNEHQKAKTNFYLHNAIRKYGIENFDFEIIEECEEHLLNSREIFWIDYYDSYNNGYNLTTGGEGTRGHKMSDEGKKILSKSHRGKSSPNKGVPHTNETKKKISDRCKGRIPWNKGKKNEYKLAPHSEEIKKKISDSNKGKKHNLTEEGRKRLSISASKQKNRLGQSPSEETRKKISESLKGKTSGIPHKKQQWITPDGIIINMSRGYVLRYHPDWIEYTGKSITEIAKKIF